VRLKNLSVLAKSKIGILSAFSRKPNSFSGTGGFSWPIQVMYGSKTLQGFKTPETNMQNFTFQATTTLQDGWGLTSVGPRTHLRNPNGQKSMCARFIGNSNLDLVKPYITYNAHCILK
jgi:hypothetical protein